MVVKSVETSQSLGQMIFGGTDNKLLRQCPCAVWLINETRQRGDRDVLVGLGYEPDNPVNQALNRQLLETGASLALSEFAKTSCIPCLAILRGEFLPLAKDEPVGCRG